MAKNTLKAPVCYIEIPAPDLKKAETFYSSVFGWDVRSSDLSGQPYSSWSTSKEQGGGFDPNLSVKDGGVLFYLEVDDIPAALKTIEDCKGAVIQKKMNLGEHGFIATFKDPNGNRVGLWSRK